MWAAQLGSTWVQVGVVAASAAAIYAAVITYVRITGLRSMAKMSGFDFVTTVAIGAMMGAVIVSSASFVDGAVGLATLFFLQALIAQLRCRIDFDAVVDNVPVLLMVGQQILDGNLRRARVTADDLHASLRAAGVTDYAQIQAVVMENTGDINVLVGDDLNPNLLRGVEHAPEHFPGPPDESAVQSDL